MSETGTSAPTIIAHRGYSAKAPENTLSAIRMAVEVGAGGIEWDITTAACGTPVLFHDTSLGRTTNGVGPVRRRTLGQLKALDAGSWFDESFSGERIPTLREACQLLNELGYAGQVIAEIKGWRELEDVDRMMEVILEEAPPGDLLVISIDWTTIDRVTRRFPHVPVAFVVESPERFDEGLERSREQAGAGLAVDYRILLDDPERIVAARTANVPLGVWTVDDPVPAAELLELGIQDFTTNEVERLLEWKKGLGSEASR